MSASAVIETDGWMAAHIVVKQESKTTVTFCKKKKTLSRYDQEQTLGVD